MPQCCPSDLFCPHAHPCLLSRRCCQELSGGVLIDTFPWNGDVVVVDDESPAADFSLQPPQDVVKYGAGIVIVQTTWVSPPVAVSAQAICRAFRADDNHTPNRKEYIGVWMRKSNRSTPPIE